MAQPSGSFSTYDAVGIREDLTDIIYNISPTDTPFFSGAGRTPSKNTKHEWQIDSLSAAAQNAVIEGDDATTDASVATQRLHNQCQISDKVARITGTQEAVDKAGRTREMAYQVAKRTRELKRDMELILTQPNNGIQTGDDSTARQLGSLPCWISTNESRGTNGLEASNLSGQLNNSSIPTDGSTRALSEGLVQSVIRSSWTSGGDPGVLMFGPFNKVAMSAFTANSAVTRFAMTDGKRLVTALDVYVSDFGEHRIVPNRFQRDRDGFVLDMEYWKVSFLRSPRNWPLAKTGDTERRQILTEFTLESCNEAASGVIADLTSS